MKYTCPSCGEGFDKTKKGKDGKGAYCPECEIKLKYIRGRNSKGNKFTGYYEIDEEVILVNNNAKLDVIKPEKEEDITVLTGYQDEPQIAIRGDNNYIVTYMQPNTDSQFIRCPKCNKGLFKTTQLEGHLQDKCDRCKTVIDIFFVLPGRSLNRVKKFISL